MLTKHSHALARSPAVVETARTTGGLLFGLPVVLDTDREDVVVGDRVLLSYKDQVSVRVLCMCACMQDRQAPLRWSEKAKKEAGRGSCQRSPRQAASVHARMPPPLSPPCLR